MAFPFKTTRAHAPQQFVGLSGSPLAAGLVYAAGGDFRFNQADGDSGGLLVGGLVVTTPRGPVLKLNGTSDYIMLGTSIGGVDLFADSDRRWSIVVNVRQMAAGTSGVLVAKTAGAAGPTLNLYLESGAVTTNIRGSYHATGSTLGLQPVQITLTWDGTTAYLHRDVNITGTRTVGTAAIESAEEITFGARNSGTSTFLNGELGYVLIYNRAISRAEHLALIKSPGAVFAMPANRFWLPSGATVFEAALSGNAATSAQGSVTPSISLAIAGNGATASAGTVSVGSTFEAALSGNSATAAAGDVTPSLSLELSGNGATASAGAVAAGLSSAVSGNAASASAGIVTPAIALSLSGNEATSSAGTVEVAGVFGAVLTGNAATSAVGSLTPSVSVAVAGASATASQGSVGAEIGKSIAGNSASSAAGSVSPSLSIAISGNSATASAGAVVPSGPIVVGLTGNGAVASAGILSVFGATPFLPQTGIDTIVESYTKDLVYQAVTRPLVFIARHHR